MNERIKEIWEEATVSVWPRPGKFTAGEYDYHIEKFAELIVRECSAFVNHFSDGHEKDQFGRKMFLYTADIGQVILEHFGVEE
jgi:hypothetical protein